MTKYKGIEFAKGYNKPFADFKIEFEQTHIFKNIPSEERENALIEAHKIANSEVNEVIVYDSKIEKANGNTIGTISQSKKP